MMSDIQNIKLFGNQPSAKISDELLEKLIIREFKVDTAVVSEKLKNVISDSQMGKNRISADILKLANKDINTLDELIERANIDSRDIMLWAEYPRCAELGFDELDENAMKQIYIDDFVEYSNWLNRKD